MEVSKKFKLLLVTAIGVLSTGLALADAGGGGSGSTSGLAGIATNVTSQFQAIGQLLIAVAYVAGFAMIIFGMFKFKQHKDNPQQTPLGTPIVMVLIGAVLVFVGGFITPAGETLLGTTNAKTAAGGWTGETGIKALPGASGSGS